MCGIAGIFDTRGTAPVDEALLRRMNEVQLHRGPDEGGIHLEPGVGLAHRRLSIIDLSSGQQPLFNEDGSVVVVYNGEIYNFAELARELTELGHTFRTHCDTEVIVHAWEAWGADCLERFRGMFAFALWDRNRQTLFVARDRLGIKPLYYTLLPDGLLAFASELKALKQLPALDRTLDERAIEEYFALGYIPEPRSIYRATHKLMPGHFLQLQRGRPVPAQQGYWDVPFQPSSGQLTVAEAEEMLVEKIREAVGIRLVAEVPLGAFLSGGVDSSCVVAMMAGLSDDPVNTCSISFGEAEYNEAAYAKAVADRYQTRHKVGAVDPDDRSLLDRLPMLYDEPFADSSAMPTYRVCELAAQDVTVVLSGDGGDENLAGYRRYAEHLGDLARKARLPSLFRHMVGAVGRVYPDHGFLPDALRRRQGLISMGQDPVETFCDINAVIKSNVRRALYTASFKARLQGHDAVDVYRRHAEKSPTDDPLSLVQYLDLKTYLPGDILTKVDRASMAHSIEVRVPLLDHKLVEWISSLPPTFKRRDGEGKYLLKKAMEKYLPNDVLYRPKQGFAVPLPAWFRGPLRERIGNAIDSPLLADTGIFDRRGLRRLLAEHDSGRRDWSSALWSVLMFEAFLGAEEGRSGELRAG